ncbi:XrtA/PEP-CTERM system TPR-repeat protein PrsT [Vibrio sp. MA40-2]|uniref:XrtA/PEP-CTERM system TPR-repeat protein PrsT n=1 Tax=Vibrio sp. MA40-2 TaxID=3391828 RepID=UPI0039A49E7F
MSYQAYKVLKKIAFFSLVSTAVITSGTTYANKYIESAEKYLQDNDINSAIIELKNAIQSTPKEAQPRIMLGEVYLNRGNFLSAEKELSRAIQLGAQLDTVLPALVRTISGQGRNDEAITLIDDAIINDNKVQTELLSLKALSQLNIGDISGAEETVKLVKEAGDTRLYSQLAQARLSAAKNDIDTAMVSVENILAQTKDNSDVWLFKGHLDSAKQQYDDAVTSYTTAYELTPDAFQYTIYIARSLVFAKQFDSAEKYVDNILNQAPNHTISNELKAAIEYDRQDYVKAKEYADRALQNGSQQISTSLIAGVSAYQLKLFEQAYSRLSQIESQLPENHFARRLYIATELHLGYIDEAIKSMNDFKVESENDSQFLSTASLQLSKLGRDEEALKLVQKASEHSGNSTDELMLGLIKLSGDDESGFDNIQAAITQQPNTEKTRVGLAYYYLKFDRDEEAKAIAEELLAEDPKNIDALLLKAQISKAEDNREQSEAIFKSVLESEPNNVRALIYYSQLLAEQQEFDKAYQMAYQAKRQDATNTTANQILLITGKQLDRISELLELIETQLADDPSNVTLLHQKARALTLNNQASNAVNLLESIPNADKDSKTWQLIGDVYYTQKKWTDAERAYEQWLALTPANSQAYVRNINIKEMTRKYLAGVNIADKAATTFPNDPRFPMMKAGLLLKAGQPENSQLVLNSVDKQAQETPLGLKLQGLIYIAQNNLPAAIEVHKLRYNKQPGLQTANELASIYVLNDQRQEAVDFLEDVIAKEPEKARALEIKLADLQIRSNPQAAIDKYQTIIVREPNNFVAANNLAWLYIDSGEFEKGNTFAEQAYKLASKSPLVSDTYGYSLLKTGKTSEAVKVLKSAYEQLPDNAEIALHYAESLIENKQTETAKTVLAGINTEEPNFVSLKQSLESRL